METFETDLFLPELGITEDPDLPDPLWQRSSLVKAEHMVIAL